MNELNKALGDISNIRRQVARSTEFRGYGPATLAATGGIAVLAAGVQAVWLPNPANRISVYLAIWVSTAILSAAFIAVQTVTRSPNAFRDGRRDDPHGRRAVLACGRCRSAVDDCPCGFCSVGSLDASRTLADHIQPRCVFVVPVSSSSDGRSGSMVSADWIDLYRTRRRSRSFSLVHGRFVWSWTVACCRHS